MWDWREWTWGRGGPTVCAEWGSQFSTRHQSKGKCAPLHWRPPPQVRYFSQMRTEHVNTVHCILVYNTTYIFSALQVKNKPCEGATTPTLILVLVSMGCKQPPPLPQSVIPNTLSRYKYTVHGKLQITYFLNMYIYIQSLLFRELYINKHCIVKKKESQLSCPPCPSQRNWFHISRFWLLWL